MFDTIFSFDTLQVILTILYVPACLGLIIIVLLQKGKGTGFAGAFGMGAGGADTVFGPKSSQSLPVKLTYIAAATFMIIALVMSIIAARVGKGEAPGLLALDPSEVGSAGGLDDLISGSNIAGIPLPGGDDGAAPNIAPSETDGEVSGDADLGDISTDGADSETESESAESPGAP